MGKQWKQCLTLFFWAPKSLQMVTAAMKLKRLLLGRKVMINPDSILKKSRDITLPTKIHLQGSGFSSDHVWMWEFDCEEGRVPKKWCFWTVVLEKTLESPLDCKEIQPVHSEGDLPWDFFGRNNAKAETPVLWPPQAKSWLIGKDSDAGGDWGQEEKETTVDEMAGWHHWLDGRESEWTPGDGDGQGGLACCDSWGCKELDTSWWLHWTELNALVIQVIKTKKVWEIFKQEETKSTWLLNIMWCGILDRILEQQQEKEEKVEEMWTDYIF